MLGMSDNMSGYIRIIQLLGMFTTVIIGTDKVEYNKGDKSCASEKDIPSATLYDPQTLDDSIAALRSMGMKAKDAKDNAKLVLSTLGDMPVEDVVREVLRMSWKGNRT